MEEDKIKAKVIIEILGAPKGHVENTLKLVLDKIKENDDYNLLNQEIYEAKEVGKLFTAFTEAEIEFKDIYKLIIFSFDFMPSSIEILEPEKFMINSNNLSDWLNDLLAMIHKQDMLLKKVNANNILLKQELDKFKRE